jgi:hypothetical protein
MTTKLIWTAFANELEKVGGDANFVQKLKNKTTEYLKTRSSRRAPSSLPSPKPAAPKFMGGHKDPVVKMHRINQ